MDADRYRAAERRLWASRGVTPTERMLHLRRNDVTVRIQEVGQGPAALFIHGANTSGASWAALASRLSGFRCLVLDRPGTGLSEPLRVAPDLERLPEFGDTLAIDILDALDLASAHLVATSFGGYIALRTAAAHPDRAERMVQFSWPAGAPIDHLPAIMRIPTLPIVGRLMTALPPTERRSGPPSVASATDPASTTAASPARTSTPTCRCSATPTRCVTSWPSAGPSCRPGAAWTASACRIRSSPASTPPPTSSGASAIRSGARRPPAISST